jgi:hypothetical protein
MAEFSNSQISLLNPSSTKSLRFDDVSINSQKNCVPGPNVQFRKKDIPFSSYLQNINRLGTLGCNPDQYPKYKDGKYCCESNMSTPQEQFDYVNMLLLSAIENVGETAFKKYSREINWLNNKRNNLLQKYKEINLIDTLKEEFPININGEEYENLDEYISKNMEISNELALDKLNTGTIQGIGLAQPGITSMNTIRNKYINKLSNQMKNNDEKAGGKSYKNTLKRKRSIRKIQKTRKRCTRKRRRFKKK